MPFPRSAAIILHPTSLPGPYGIGDLGPPAYRWTDWLASSGCTWWQVLPLNPTGYGDSPYQSFSAFAGNPYLVSPELLMADGLLTPAEAFPPPFPQDRVDFGAVIPWKLALLDRAHERFLGHASADLGDAWDTFRREHASWLDDYALFMAIKDAHGGGAWTDWPTDLIRREPAALEAARSTLTEAIARHAFRQFLFFRQWAALRAHVIDRGLRILGDAPIFVAADSADVWANRNLFRVGADGRPEVVAGVPPDYFSATGQLWGNPLYDWNVHAATGFSWWIERLRTVFGLVDALRIDHFRAFSDYWEIPAGAPTAETGRWRNGPGMAFFRAVRAALGELAIVAEDLGELSPKVPKLLAATGLPGMRILHFAFDGEPDNEFLPHLYPEQCVAYTGTHDNDTTLGWYRSVTARERRRTRRYLGSDGRDIVGDMLAAVWASRAVIAGAPLQDLLRLGTGARMNTPGTAAGNWSWRLRAESLTDELAAELGALNEATGRTRR